MKLYRTWRGVAKYCIYLALTVLKGLFTKDLKEFTMGKEIEKLSLAKCKSILEKEGSIYTDEQVIEIRDFLYRIAELDYEVFVKTKIREMEFEKEKQATAENDDLKSAA